MTILDPNQSDTQREKGDGLEEDNLGKFVGIDDYEALLQVKPTLPENCENCFEDLHDVQKVYVVERDDTYAFCPACATMNKVKNIL